ncbi:MAG TPA: hypothetical protein DER56_02280 [Thermosipho africanus]|nr:hypothetical protein [Thermosipho africanus]
MTKEELIEAIAGFDLIIEKFTSLRDELVGYTAKDHEFTKDEEAAAMGKIMMAFVEMDAFSK